MDSQELKQFMDRINNYHSTIKFTYDRHNQEIPFWTPLYTGPKKTSSSLGITINPQITNNIYIITQLIPEDRRSQSLMAY